MFFHTLRISFSDIDSGGFIKHIIFTYTLVFILCSSTSYTLHASDAIEEVLVTAGFRDDELMKSAGSISVLDEQLIRDRVARHFDETVNILPNVTFSAGGARARFVQIRGVGDLEQFVDPKHFPSVGITIDDIEVGTTATGAVLMDVAQIELLRGPQGTQFGANALAGIINIRTHEPSEVFTGNIEASYSNFDSWLVGANVSGPLSDSIGGRLSIQQNMSDGYYSNDFIKRNNTNKRDELSMRGKLRWTNSNAAEINLIASYADLDGGYDAFSLDNVRNTISDNPGNDKQETVALAIKANWPMLQGINLETLLSWRDSNEDYAFDEDWVFSGFCDGVRCDPLFEFSSTDKLLRQSDVVAVDIRLKSDPARFAWVAGVYAQKRNEDLQRQHFGTFSSDYQSNRYAIYGQVQLDIAENWNVTAGLRYEYFEDKYSDTNKLTTRSTDGYWSGQFTVEYLFGENTLIYGTLARSVKPGGVNTETSSNFPVINRLFKPFLQSRQQFAAETLFNKEIGVKSSYIDDKLTSRLALFHMDRANAQLESFIWDASTFIFTGFLDSSSNAENYGAELEITYQLTTNIDLFSNIGYLETRVVELTVFDLDSSQFITRNNRNQTKAPNWQYNLGINMNFTEKLHGRLEVEGQDDSFFGYYHDGKIDAFTLTHASVDYQIGKVKLQAWVHNIFNEQTQIHGLYFANDPRDGFAINRSYFQHGEPRVYGANFNYSF
ncbi:MAG: iron complex outermembrane receptor protein [Gammaproteobacteria bacterium]